MIAFIQRIRASFARWWSEFTLQTKLMVLATLVVSLMTTGLTFWAVNSIHQDARMNDTRFGRDLGQLLAANISPMLAEEDLAGVAQFSNRFYSSTSSIRYLLLADEDGEIFLGVPFSRAEVQNSLVIQRRIQLPPEFKASTDIPLIRQHRTPKGEVTDVFIPLVHDDRYLGVLAVGINPNAIVVTSSNLTRDVTIAVFVAIWAMVILGAVINALTITRPIKELLEGVTNIAEGRFEQRINLPFGGELGALIASFNDMAARLGRYEAQNIEEMTAEKAKLETLVSTIADGALLVDKDLNLLLANTTARKLFNWEKTEALIGKNILASLPPALRNELTQPIYDLLESAQQRSNLEEAAAESSHLLSGLSGELSGETATLSGDAPEPVELRITLEDPTRRTLRVLLSAVSGQRLDNLRGIAITIQDITRETELNEAKGRFISNVSHELRTPLFNIKSFIETLHDYGDELSEQDQKDFLATANHETDRLTRLVNDVLDLSRLESNRSYQFDAVDVGQAIDQTLRSYRLNAKDKGIELSFELEPQLPHVHGNYDLLLQVLANLVGNAMKFTSKGDRIVLRAYQLDPEILPERSHSSHHGIQCVALPKVRLEVSDTGIGIAPEDQTAIFDRFFRVENRVHTLEGTGLGLSIVRNIVDRHRSKVQLVSEDGVGTTFWIDLNAFQSAPMDEADAPGESAMATRPA